MSMRKWRHVVVSFCLLGTGMMLGSALNTSSTAWGEVRRTPPPQAFQSGSQQSVPILREIAATLQQMDGRLARLEAMAKEIHGTGSIRKSGN
jgi:hypothetical protein